MSREILPPRAEGGRKFAWHPAPSIALADYVATFRSVELPCRSWEAGFQMLVSLLYRMVLQNGPEPSRARRQARRSEPFTARTVLRGWRKRETRRSISEAQQAKRKQPACVRVSTIVLFETR